MSPSARGCLKGGGGQKTIAMYSKYNPNLKETSQKLRKTMTKAEACLWKYVLKAKKTGHSFKRQKPIDNYIVDFVCTELKFIIEVDGESHNDEEIGKNDIIRQKELERKGYIVMRFTDDEIITSINSVSQVINDILKSLSKSQ